MRHMRARVVSLVAAGSLAWIVLGASAQSPDRETAPPGPGREEGPPVKKHKQDLEGTYIRMPLAPGDEAYGRIGGARLKALVNDVTGISRRSRDDGNRYWGRIAGTKYTEMTAQLIADRFRAAGLQDVHLQYLDLPPQWFPVSWDLTATGSGETLTFKTVFPGGRSAATPAGGLDLEPVWVGLGTELDFAGRDVKGKLAFIHSVASPSAFQHSAAYERAMDRAVKKGAAALLVNVAIPGNYTNQIGAAPGVPTFAIGSEDATALKALMIQGPVKVHLALQTEMRPGLKDANAWGTLPGASDEEIVLIAHSDGYFESAFDNASGLAVMTGLAEYFAKVPADKRRRTLKFVATAAHHAGSPGTRWMHDHRDTALAKTVLMINCEHTSITDTYSYGPALRRSNNINARRWWVNGSDRLAAIALGAWHRFGVTVFEGMESAASGDMGPVSRDLPSIQLIVSPVYYHSDQDRPEIVPEAGLEATARAYAKIIDEVNRLSRADLLPPPPGPTSGQGP